MIKKRLIAVFAALFFCLASFLFSACTEGTPQIRVMVENGEHFQVIGENVKTVSSGEDASFKIGIDEGFYYVSNNKNAEFSNGVLTLRNVKTPQRVVLKVEAEIYGVKLNACAGMKIFDGEQLFSDGLLKEVAHGKSVSFDVRIDDDMEYVGCTVVGTGATEGAVTYRDGKIILSDVRGAWEIFVQLRNKGAQAGEKSIVRLLSGTGYSILGESEKEVESGGSVSFAVETAEGYYYVSNNCGAEYTDGTVTLKNVFSDQEIRLIFRRSDIQTINYANGKAEIETTEYGKRYIAEASEGYIFTYWTYLSAGEREIYSYANRIFVPESDKIDLTPMFVQEKEVQVVVYHANGGKVYDSDAESVVYAFDSDIYLYPAAMGEWCFKTFYRPGYVPVEYNFLPDGSGQAISLGGRILSDEKTIDLYLMWEKESPVGDFSYERISSENGEEIRLLSYRGGESKVTVPTEIEGMPVRTVAERCFSGWCGSQIVLSPNLKTVEKYAFDGCPTLKTVYLCDSVENIYNESFRNCENFSELRMIAVLPPVYSDHLIGATVRRFETLYHERGDNRIKILFYGGSSVFQGIDGKTLANMFNPYSYRILNCGQNAYISGALMLELYSYFMNSANILRNADVMVYMPEYSEATYSNELDMPSWMALEALYNEIRLVDIRDYKNIFGAFRDMQHGSGRYTFVGKLELLRDGKALTYEDYNDSFDEYFTRSENFEIIKTAQKSEPMDADLNTLRTLAKNVICELNARFYQAYGLTMYFASGCLWKDAYTEEKSVFAEYENWLRENLNFAYISDFSNHFLDLEYISDSISHLTREGAVLHSRVLGNELISRMRLDGYAI